MKDIRCSECGRFLCKLQFGEIEIKCPNSRCKHLNKVKLTTYKQLLTVKPLEASIRL